MCTVSGCSCSEFNQKLTKSDSTVELVEQSLANIILVACDVRNLQLQGGSLNVADDSCRVLLRDSSSDYINASHVEYIVRDANIEVTRCHYIATQVLLCYVVIFQ